MKLVLAHDYLIQMGGAERVVAAMHRRFPDAPIYTSAVARDTLWEDFANADIRTSWLQHAPFIEDHIHFKKYFALYPWAFRSFGRVQADSAWISSSTFAKYLRFAPGTRTVCYIHNPTRFLWQTDDYLRHEVSKPLVNRLIRSLVPMLRKIDRAAVDRMSVLVANSRNVQQRIQTAYGRDSIVIPPPVQTSRFEVSRTSENFHLIVSRLVGYKNIDLAVRAFTQSGRRLVIIGDGPHRSVLEWLAGPSIKFLGRVSEENTKSYFERCRGLIFPGDEDFGITPVEAMACGKPVIAFKKGGALETVVEGKTGTLFPEANVTSLLSAVERADQITWDPALLREHAEQFSEERFLERMTAVLSTPISAA